MIPAPYLSSPASFTIAHTYASDNWLQESREHKFVLYLFYDDDGTSFPEECAMHVNREWIGLLLELLYLIITMSMISAKIALH